MNTQTKNKPEYTGFLAGTIILESKFDYKHNVGFVIHTPSTFLCFFSLCAFCAVWVQHSRVKPQKTEKPASGLLLDCVSCNRPVIVCIADASMRLDLM